MPIKQRVTSQGVRDLNSPTSRPRRVLTNPCVVGLHAPGRWRRSESGHFEEQVCANCGAVVDSRAETISV